MFFLKVKTIIDYLFQINGNINACTFNATIHGTQSSIGFAFLTLKVSEFNHIISIDSELSRIPRNKFVIKLFRIQCLVQFVDLIFYYILLYNLFEKLVYFVKNA